MTSIERKLVFALYWFGICFGKQSIKISQSTLNQDYSTKVSSETGLLSPITKWLDQFLDRSQYSVDIVKLNKNETYKTSLISWGGDALTQKEKDNIAHIRLQLIHKNKERMKSKWLNGISDAEIIRFLRADEGSVTATWANIVKHCKWRDSNRGADSTKYSYRHSNLHYEMFWLGVDKTGVPTLVIRTQMHDGVDYNEDPVIFTGFVVQLLEEGRRKYGVGVKTQMNLIMDRGGGVLRCGNAKIEKLDFTAIPNLMKLFKYLFSTVMGNYPGILKDVRVAPASKFFSICFGITGRVMDKQTRQKFQMIRERDTSKVFTRFFHVDALPPHLGGTGKGIISATSTPYTSLVTIP